MDRSDRRLPWLVATLATLAAAGLAPPARAQSGGPASAQEQAIEAQLAEGRFVRAARAARMAVAEFAATLTGASADAVPLGRLLALQAVAEAGAAETAEALYTWSLAQSLDPGLARADFSRFGPIATLLASNPRRPLADDGQLAEGEAAPIRNLFQAAPGVVAAIPREDRAPAPSHPEGARAAGVSGSVILQVLIDRQGRTLAPAVVDSPSPVLSWAAAEAVRLWRFRPAEVDGRPVAVAYNLRLEFRTR